MVDTPRTAEGLAAGWVEMPDGVKMPASRFLAVYGATMASYPDARFAIWVPGYHSTDVQAATLSGFVLFVAEEAVSHYFPGMERLGRLVVVLAEPEATELTKHMLARFNYDGHVEIWTAAQLLKGTRG